MAVFLLPLAMNDYVFTLRYRCANPAQGNYPDFPGLYCLELRRAAPNARQAVLAALRELRELIPFGGLVAVGPDLIGFAGVADLFGVNQKNMRALMAKYGPLFPDPVMVGGEPAWHAVDILGLINVQGWRDISEAELEMAALARQLNLSIR